MFYIELNFSRCFLEGKWKFLCQINYRNASYFKQVTSRRFIMSIQFSSVTQLCLTPCDIMDCSMQGLPVHHQLSEFTKTHVCWVGDAIQPSHPLLSPSPPTFNLSSIRVFSNESVLCIRWPNYWSFSFNISPSNEYSRLIPLGWTGWIFLQSKGLSRVFSSTTVQKHQFFSTQLSL